MQKQLLTAATAGLFFMFSCSSAGKKEAPAKPTAPPVVKVDGYVVTPQLLAQDIEVPGSLTAFKETELHPEASGRVTAVYFKEGAMVKQGATLLKIYDGDLQAQLSKLQVQLKTAQQTADRYAALLKINGVSQQEYDLNVLAVNNIIADMNLIRTSIAKTTLHAPFSGKIGITTIVPGAYVSPQTTVATLRSVSPLKLDFTVPETYGTKMKQGTLVNFTVEGSDKTYPATISATENEIAAENRNLRIMALVTKQDAQLIAGAFAKVKISLGENNAALMIPSQAIIPKARTKEVMLVLNGVATRQVVTTGIRDSANVEITTGLKAGDTVLISGILTVKPGAKVALNKITKP